MRKENYVNLCIYIALMIKFMFQLFDLRKQVKSKCTVKF